jgi:serpin B
MDASLCPLSLVGDQFNTSANACQLLAGSVENSQSDVRAVEQALNQFALDLYETILNTNSSEPADQAISPFSIAAALAMTYAGARGETASQLAHVLHVNLPPERFHAAMGTILQAVLPDASSSSVQLDIANSLWGQTGFPVLDPFRQLTHDRYGAGLQEVDFTSGDEAKNAINDWVRTQTHDMIDKLFDQLASSTRLVLANAIYFKASWASAFDQSATHRTVFHLASGENTNVAMMHSEGYFGYTETTDYQIAELPYEGGRYSMVVLLPKQTNTPLTANFSADDLESWMTALHSADLSVALPRFKLNTSLDLVGTLKSLGVTNAFVLSPGPQSADFSGIDGRRNLSIDQVIHKAVVEVSETGTKAAAATGISIGTITAAAHPPRTPIPFYADHPFHFLIRDRATDSILFLGQVQQPTAYTGSDPSTEELPRLKWERPAVANNPFDVDGDGHETPLDVLIVINYLNEQAFQSAGGHQVTAVAGSQMRCDVDLDGRVVPLDALILINRLNDRARQAAELVLIDVSVPGEGEAADSGLCNSAAVDALLQLADKRRALQTR